MKSAPIKKAMGKLDAHSLRIKMMASYLHYLVTNRCTKTFIFDEIWNLNFPPKTNKSILRTSQDFFYFITDYLVWSWPVTQEIAHCSVSSNSFHGQITQKAVHQITDPENKKCSHWNFFGTNHPQNLRFLSRRGPRSLDMRLSQHYIGPKMTFDIFQISAEKSFQAWKKKFSVLIE